MTIDVDIAVIGAGLTGAATAWAASREGRSVALLEAFDFGHDRGSSHGTSRIFRRVYSDSMYVAMTARARDGWSRLESETGRALLHTTGGIDHGSRRDPKGLASIMDGLGVAHELLSAVEAADRWPGMVFRGPVLFHPEAGVINADAGIAAFLEAARGNGAVLLPRQPVERVELRDDRVTVHSGTVVRAERVVIAVGPWLPEFAADAGLEVPLPPLKVTQQQVFHFPVRDPGADWPILVHKGDLQVFGLPSGADGGPGPAMKIAQHDGGIPAMATGRTGVIDPEGRQRILDHVGEWFPGLDPSLVAEGTCMYTTTADDDFIMDRWGPLIIASPCSGHGAKFAPLIGEMVTDLALGRRDPNPRFALNRASATH
jgi:sarcosine oxidase